MFSEILADDYDTDFNKYKYLGFLTNPEGAKYLENAQNNAKMLQNGGNKRIGNQKYLSGREADSDSKIRKIRENLLKKREENREDNYDFLY